MQELAALQDIEATAVEPKIILDVIERERRKKAVLANICKVDRTLVRTKGRSINIPKRGLQKAIAVGEGQNITTLSGLVDVTYTTVQVTPTKIGTYFKVTSEQINAQEIDIVNESIKDAGAAIADYEDDAIKDVLIGASAASTTLGAAGTTLTFEDLVSAKTRVVGEKYAPNLVVLSPLRADELVKDGTRFVEQAEIGKQVLIEGAIGRYAGMDLLISNAMPDTKVIVMDKEAAPWYVLRRDVDLKRDEKPEIDAIAFYAYKEFKAQVTQPEGICMVTL